MAVGGSINTVILRSRETTHDIDFFAESVTQQQKRALQDAARRVATTFRPRLDGDWLNNSTALFIDPSIRQQLEHDAVRQNVLLFSEPGLTVYAAPWMYLFASKLDRIAGGGKGTAQAYDPHDAYHFLQQHLLLAQRDTMTLAEIQSHLERYRLGRISKRGLTVAANKINDAGQQSRGPMLIRLS